jgi:sugar phosphate isomerase/epimerase
MAADAIRPRIISVSAAPYDGHETVAMLESLARCGVTHVEPAYIVGYTEPFDESAFTEAAASRWRTALAGSGLSCFALSAHIDLGTEEVLPVFLRRMDFARAIGARVINTNASLRSRQTQFQKTIDWLARHAQDIGLQIGLENPGNGEDNLFNIAADGHDLITRLALPGVGLNFDPANLGSHRPEADVTANTLASLPDCLHFHLKDVKRVASGWCFTPLGQGDLDLATIIAALATYRDLPLSIELPLRLRRGTDAQPIRAPHPLPITEIEVAISQSLRYLRRFADDEPRQKEPADGG